MKLLIATRNAGKIIEIRKALDIQDLELLTYHEVGDWPEAEESGLTLEENAAIKATAAMLHFQMPALSDDSGLMVDALGGRPGVRSSRYAGPEGDPERNMDLLLMEMADVPDAARNARFRCVVALSSPESEVVTTFGECEGRILTGRRGAGGFGYDPIFQPTGYNCSMAELAVEEKNEISHRGKALRAMKELLSPPGV